MYFNLSPIITGVFIAAVLMVLIFCICVDISVLLLAVAFVLSSLIGMFPLLPGGLGTFNGLMI